MATEPVSTTSAAFIITGAVGAALGPVYGPAALMLFAAIIGGLVALSSTPTPDKWAAARFLLVAVGLSLALTGAGVWLLEKWTPLPGSVALMPVALFFAAARNMILGTIQKVLDRLVGMMPAGKGGDA